MSHYLIAPELQRRALARIARSGADLDRGSRRIVRAENAILHGARAATTKTAKHWVEALMLAEQWVDRHGEPPRRSANPWEMMLALWLERQRASKQLSAYQVARLAVSPATVDAYTTWFQKRVVEYSTFIREHERTPTANRSNPEELALARWWGRQMTALRLGNLPAGRRVIVERLLAASRVNRTRNAA